MDSPPDTPFTFLCCCASFVALLIVFPCRVSKSGRGVVSGVWGRPPIWRISVLGLRSF
jgi:hypothetical protein